MTCRCNGRRLEFGGWMGPTPEAPFPRPCTCSPDLTPRQIQVIVAEWLLDNPDDPKVQNVRASMAVHDAAQHYRKVVVAPFRAPFRGYGAATVEDADLVVVGHDRTVVKDRYGAAGYKLSQTELRRIRADCESYVMLQ